MIDDVITAGTTFRQVVQMIHANNAKITGVFTAHDRQEVGLNGDQLAVKDLKAEFKVPFYSMIKLTDIIQYLDVQGKMTCELERLRDYQTEYGVML